MHACLQSCVIFTGIRYHPPRQINTQGGVQKAHEKRKNGCNESRGRGGTAIPVNTGCRKLEPENESERQKKCARQSGSTG